MTPEGRPFVGEVEWEKEPRLWHLALAGPGGVAHLRAFDRDQLDFAREAVLAAIRAAAQETREACAKLVKGWVAARSAEQRARDDYFGMDAEIAAAIEALPVPPA